MASSSLLPALWVHRVSSPPSPVPPPPPLGALPPQPPSTSTATSATTLVHARGLGLCHLTKVPPFHCTQLLELGPGDRGSDRLVWWTRPRRLGYANGGGGTQSPRASGPGGLTCLVGPGGAPVTAMSCRTAHAPLSLWGSWT